jgi:MOSC domain-containing protein YiiM
MSAGPSGVVVGVHRSATHSFSKPTVASIRLVEGIGIEGDAHSGATVKHRSRVRRNAAEPNLRQVHLIHAELLADLAAVGHVVQPGELGENVTTRGVDLLGLPHGARLHIGPAVVAVTGLRNPCQQINDFQPGLLRHVLRTDEDGAVIRLVGVMATVARGGDISAGDAIEVELPPEPHLPLPIV